MRIIEEGKSWYRSSPENKTLIMIGFFANRGYFMQEQVALLMQNRGEWIFIADDDDSERVFKSVKEAMEELRQDG